MQFILTVYQERPSKADILCGEDFLRALYKTQAGFDYSCFQSSSKLKLLKITFYGTELQCLNDLSVYVSGKLQNYFLKIILTSPWAISAHLWRWWWDGVTITWLCLYQRSSPISWNVKQCTSPKCSLPVGDRVGMNVRCISLGSKWLPRQKMSPGSAPQSLCELGNVTQPLSITTFLFIKWR